VKSSASFEKPSGNHLKPPAPVGRGSAKRVESFSGYVELLATHVESFATHAECSACFEKPLANHAECLA